MTAQAVLDEVRACAVEIEVRGSDLLVRPSSGLSEYLRAELRRFKGEVIEILRHEQANPSDPLSKTQHATPQVDGHISDGAPEADMTPDQGCSGVASPRGVSHEDPPVSSRALRVACGEALTLTNRIRVEAERQGWPRTVLHINPLSGRPYETVLPGRENWSALLEVLMARDELERLRVLEAALETSGGRKQQTD